MSDEMVLIERDDVRMLVKFTEAAIAIKDEALSASALIGTVTNPEAQEAAVAAQLKLNEAIKLAERSRKAAKEPVIDYGRKIDAAAKEFKAELEAEQLRITTAIGDFQQLEQAKVRAAQNAQNEHLTAIERERMAALAEAKTHDELDRINEEYDQKVNDVHKPIHTPRAKGQVVSNDWEVTVQDIHALYRFHPNCVKLTPLVGEIKGLLDSGIKVHGVLADRIVKSEVRAPKAGEAIVV